MNSRAYIITSEVNGRKMGDKYVSMSDSIGGALENFVDGQKAKGEKSIFDKAGLVNTGPVPKMQLTIEKAYEVYKPAT